MATAAPPAEGHLAQLVEASLSAVDEQQRAMMEERVIVTDYFDNPLGSGSKKESACTPARASSGGSGLSLSPPSLRARPTGRAH
jgi:hypothetical protein